MAVRILALLIPLAITLPQLQSSRPADPAAHDPIAHAQPAASSEWSYEPRRNPDAAMTHVVLEAPAQAALHTIDSPSPVVPVAAVEAAPAVPAAVACKPTALRAVAKIVRPVPLAKSTRIAAASTRAAPRHVKHQVLRGGCEPGLHCAPVVVAKVTPVSRRAL